MQIFRHAPNPWGQEVLLGIGWDLMWAAFLGGILFLILHAVLVARAKNRAAVAQPAVAPATGVPARISRHSKGVRFFHWTMAVAMFTLLITAFVPVMGYQFDWVTIHWIAGLALIATVIYHIVQAVFWQSMRNVWISRRDVREGMGELTSIMKGEAPPPVRPGKYPVAQKLFHHVATLATLAAIVTGLFMMVRIDTPLFAQNQYMLSDRAWGYVYVLHGLGGVALISLVIAHVYFAIRPEKRWLTRSMIKGWITREEYLTHHDPDRWELGSKDAVPENEIISAPPTAGQRA